MGHFNKLEFILSKNNLYQFWLKLAQWFCRKRWKCEKFAMTTTPTDNRKAYLSLRFKWANNDILVIVHIKICSVLHCLWAKQVIDISIGQYLSPARPWWLGCAMWPMGLMYWLLFSLSPIALIIHNSVQTNVIFAHPCK